MRSERLTKILPSRRRMVVFRDVKRRKRTAMEGIGARGRNARYSCSKIGMRSRVTKFEISTFKSRYLGEGNREQKPEKLKHLRARRGRLIAVWVLRVPGRVRLYACRNM